MGNPQEISMQAAHEAIQEGLRQAFPVLSVMAYESLKERVACPAAFLNLAALEPGDDVGTEQLAVRIRWELHLVMHFKAANVNLEICALVGAVSKWLHGNRFGLPAHPAEFVGAYPDEWKPEQRAYEEWRIEFEQRVYLGASAWTDEGVIPQTVLVSWSPRVGVDYKPEYTEVTDAELPTV
ncbi:hypothetical protein DSM19430T_30020 [Desulfovibrio psychrotolerans]|uniref:Phage protein n=2 Tax=Desulfovibrio psychrotolerans TaxID=415242 RepID=A0A7J0BX95_9BACT|nr:hypothetical protein DSM19430T_30020 [Desulfovibrio psychrotolerans]